VSAAALARALADRPTLALTAGTLAVAAALLPGARRHGPLALALLAATAGAGLIATAPISAAAPVVAGMSASCALVAASERIRRIRP
jgi:hypothetical protein